MIKIQAFIRERFFRLQIIKLISLLYSQMLYFEMIKKMYFAIMNNSNVKCSLMTNNK